ncbi:MAG: hypothetical protein WAT39_01275 [Planctomycetota bacterium]
MPDIPDSKAGRVGDVVWEARAEWLAGRYWWRVYVAGHPKVLVRYAEHAAAAAEALAADELQFRRESTAAE